MSPVAAMQLRVCLLAARFPPDLNGIGDYTYFLANGLAAAGHDVQVLTSVGGSDPALYPLGQGVRLHRMVRNWGVRGLWSLVQGIRVLRPDAVVIQYAPHAFDYRGVTLAVNVLPWLIHALTRTRVMVNFHELYIPFDRRLAHFPLALWQRFAAFVLASGSYGLMANTRDWPRQLKRIGVRRHIVITPVGSSIPLVQMKPDERDAVRGLLGADKGTILVGCFGSAGVDRDKELLLKAVRNVKKKCPLKVVWIGNTGPRTRPLANDDNIIWTGPLPHPEVSRLMTACDVFAYPFTDGISTKRSSLAAALSHGLPILATRGATLDDLFVHRENVYLVSQGDTQGFEDGLQELALHPELRDRLSRGGRALHDRHFAWHTIAEQLLKSLNAA